MSDIFFSKTVSLIDYLIIFHVPDDMILFIVYHPVSDIYSNFRINRNEVINIVKEKHIQRDTLSAFCSVCSGQGHQ